VQEHTPPETTVTASGTGAVTGLCIECALRRHEYHEVLGSDPRSAGPPDTPLPQALIDGRPHVLLSYAWTHQDRCSECKGPATNLYLPVR
jgi:hypothetical protein